MTRAILMHAATELDADLFHAVPVGIVDSFLYAEVDGRRAALTWVAEADKFRELGIEILDRDALGAAGLARAGMAETAIDAELALRACRELGITAAAVPARFPLYVADRLRAAGIAVDVDDEGFASRRRAKNEQELAGMRRAQAAADAAMAVARTMIRELRSAEDVRAAIRAVCDERGCDVPDDVIVAHGAQSAVGHEAGHGVPEAGEPVIVDIWPRDRRSRCWADMTRTFVAGGAAAPDELRRYWELTRRAIEDARAGVRAGASGNELWRRACAPYEAEGLPTQQTAADGETLHEGFNHSLGHGVGLEIHERPYLGRVEDTLVAGDVVTLEPGCYRVGFGGCRLEDLVLVGEDGSETLTDFPYDLE